MLLIFFILAEETGFLSTAMIKKIILSVSHSGVEEDQTVLFTDKLIVRNHFAFICAFFSCIYLFYFISNDYAIGAACISVSIALFIACIALNNFRYYTLSKAILILVTNFSVLFTSILFGFKSGFHLYLLTSPLITFMLFESKQTIIIILSILSYCLNFAVLLLLHKYYDIESAFVNHEQSDTMYLLNFSFTIFIIITLLLYYSYNNTKVNSLLNSTNEELVAQQTRLKKEIAIRKNTEEELVSLLSDKSMLLTEINHRVKNNLAVISGLLELETMYTSHEGTNKVIRENKDRIKSIALLHEQLYENEAIGMVNMKEIILPLYRNLFNSYKLKGSELFMKWEVDEIVLTMDIALPVTLIVNEIIATTFKEGPESIKGIDLSIRKNNNKITIAFHAAIPCDPTYEASFKNSFAYNLIETMVTQVNGVSEYTFTNGLNFKTSF